MSSDDDDRIKPERFATPTVSEPDEKKPVDEIHVFDEDGRRSKRRIANIYDAVGGKDLFPNANGQCLTSQSKVAYLTKEAP